MSGRWSCGVGDGGAEKEFSVSGEVAELGDVGGAQRDGKNRGCDGGKGELDEIAAVHEWSVGDEFEGDFNTEGTEEHGEEVKERRRKGSD